MAEFARHSRAAAEPEFLPPETPQRKPAPARRFVDATDADFIVLPATAPAAGPINDNRPAPSRAAPSVPMLAAHLLVAAARLGERALSGLSGQAFATLTGLAALTVFTLVVGIGSAGLRNDAASPPPAIPAETLAIDAIHSHVEQANGMNLLVVTGKVVNRGMSARAVPRLRLALGDPARPDRTAEISPMSGVLEPGQAAAFRVRINQPGGKPSDIHLSFVPPAGSDGPL